MEKFLLFIPFLVAIFLIKTSLGFLELNLSHAIVLNEDQKDFVDIHLARVKKMNKTHHAIIANFTLKSGIDNSFKVGCFAYKKSGNMYKIMPYKVENQFCDALNSDEYFYPELHKVTNFPEIGTCPWPAGNYVINNYLPDFSKLPTALMQSGDYMLECKFFDKDGKFLNGIQTYGQLIAIAGGK